MWRNEAIHACNHDFGDTKGDDHCYGDLPAKLRYQGTRKGTSCYLVRRIHFTVPCRLVLATYDHGSILGTSQPLPWKVVASLNKLLEPRKISMLDKFTVESAWVIMSALFELLSSS
jgi:hypothetical protein